MAEQKSRGARGVRKRAGAATEQAGGGVRKAAQEAGSTASRTASGVTDAPEEVADQVRDTVEGSHSGSDRRGGESQTMREELGSIIRETAIEVLGPVMRTATKSAAKYAIRKAPEMALERALPKLRELQSSVQDAGGAGAFARESLGSASEGGGLSRLKQLGRGDEDSGKASERVPEQESVDVAAPLETVYEQFTQLDDFAELLSGGDLLDEQENERIVWTNERENATAVITFHRLDDRLTRVMVSYDQEPQNFAGKALSALHTRKKSLRSDLARFKAVIEMGELEREDGGDAASDGDPEAPRGRRRSSREEGSSQDESEDEEYGEAEEEPYDAEEEDEPEAESGEVIDAESEEVPEDEGDDSPEAESDVEPEEEPEPAPKRRPARTRAPRRRAPAKASKSPRAKRS